MLPVIQSKDYVCFPSRSLTSTVLPPTLPSVRIFSTSSWLLSIAAMSSAPPMLLPLIMMFGTVFRPVIFANLSCIGLPS